MCVLGLLVVKTCDLTGSILVPELGGTRMLPAATAAAADTQTDRCTAQALSQPFHAEVSAKVDEARARNSMAHCSEVVFAVRDPRPEELHGHVGVNVIQEKQPPELMDTQILVHLPVR